MGVGVRKECFAQLDMLQDDGAVRRPEALAFRAVGAQASLQRHELYQLQIYHILIERRELVRRFGPRCAQFRWPPEREAVQLQEDDAREDGHEEARENRPNSLCILNRWSSGFRFGRTASHHKSDSKYCCRIAPFHC